MPTISRKNVPGEDGRLRCMSCHGEIPADQWRKDNGDYRSFCSDACRGAWMVSALRLLRNAGLLGCSYGR